ncbi:MAG: hypothetical protein ACKVS6_02255 [Planctomycetota bacterium]
MRIRTLPSVVLAAGLFVAMSPVASACPTCGIGDKLGMWGPVVYLTFIAAPFFISYGVFRYIRNLNKLDQP